MSRAITSQIKFTADVAPALMELVDYPNQTKTLGFISVRDLIPEEFNNPGTSVEVELTITVKPYNRNKPDEFKIENRNELV